MPETARDPWLLTPGPLTTSATVKAAMLHDWGSRDARFIAINRQIRERLVELAGATGSHVCVPLQGSGTFAVEAMLATPICPHTLSIRPLLFPANETLEVRFRSDAESVHLAVDGQLMLELSTDRSIRVRRARRPILFVLVENRSFYEVLRTKLRWGGA